VRLNLRKDAGRPAAAFPALYPLFPDVALHQCTSFQGDPVRKPILWMLLAIPCLASRNARVDWPGLRGPNGSGVSEGGKLPAGMGPERNLVWKTALPPGHSSPALTESASSSRPRKATSC